MKILTCWHHFDKYQGKDQNTESWLHTGRLGTHDIYDIAWHLGEYTLSYPLGVLLLTQQNPIGNIS